jgi:hypothetical protein
MRAAKEASCLAVIKAHGSPRVDLLQLFYTLRGDDSDTLSCTWRLDHECSHVRQPRRADGNSYKVEYDSYEADNDF